jgi:hypothetical protein
MIKAHVVTGLTESGEVPNLYSGNDPLAAIEAFEKPPGDIVETRWDRLGDHEHFKRRGFVLAAKVQSPKPKVKIAKPKAQGPKTEVSSEESIAPTPAAESVTDQMPATASPGAPETAAPPEPEGEGLKPEGSAETEDLAPGEDVPEAESKVQGTKAKVKTARGRV